MVKSIDLNYAPRQAIAQRLGGELLVEMSEFDSAFLCGLLTKFRPKRILEVGVAGGGGTAVILQCLHDMKYSWEMYSVDISEQYYRDKKEKTGFIGEKAKNILEIKNHTLLTGHSLAYYIDKVNFDFDFVVLDTTHCIPGEILDFILLVPYLQKNAVVCLHDIALNKLSFDAICPNVLFGAVVAEKYLNYIPEQTSNSDYPNIGAFQITNDTLKYIENIFCLLSLNWTQPIKSEEIELYKDSIRKNYDDSLFRLFESIMRMDKIPKLTIKKRIQKAINLLLKGNL